MRPAIEEPEKNRLTCAELRSITGWDFCGDASGGVVVWLRGMPRGTVLGTDRGVGVELGMLDEAGIAAARLSGGGRP